MSPLELKENTSGERQKHGISAWERSVRLMPSTAISAGVSRRGTPYRHKGAKERTQIHKTYIGTGIRLAICRCISLRYTEICLESALLDKDKGFN